MSLEKGPLYTTFKRKLHLPTIKFWGDIFVFRGISFKVFMHWSCFYQKNTSIRGKILPKTYESVFDLLRLEIPKNTGLVLWNHPDGDVFGCHKYRWGKVLEYPYQIPRVTRVTLPTNLRDTLTSCKMDDDIRSFKWKCYEKSCAFSLP